MTVVAVAEQVVLVPLEVAFARFSDFSQWERWMPANFRPVAGPSGALGLGDKFRVGIGLKQRLTLGLEVVRMEINHELCWRGGPALLKGEHAFLFADVEGSTRVRSEETLTGLMTYGPLGRRIERECVKAAAELLARFAEHAQAG